MCGVPVNSPTGVHIPHCVSKKKTQAIPQKTIQIFEVINNKTKAQRHKINC